MMKKLIVITSLLVVSAFAQVDGMVEVPNIDYKMKEAKGIESVQANCSMCHSFGYMENQGLQSRKFWHDKVLKMVHAFKAPIAKEDIPVIVDYLYHNYGNGKLK